MQFGWLAVGVALLVLGPAPLAVATDSMRCGSKIINKGDTSSVVRKLCGEPEEIIRTTIMRRPSYVRAGQVIYYGDELVETPAETWTYNFGPNKLMQRLRIVDGWVESIQTLEYGHR